MVKGGGGSWATSRMTQISRCFQEGRPVIGEGGAVGHRWILWEGHIRVFRLGRWGDDRKLPSLSAGSQSNHTLHTLWGHVQAGLSLGMSFLWLFCSVSLLYQCLFQLSLAIGKLFWHILSQSIIHLCHSFSPNSGNSIQSALCLGSLPFPP